MSEPVADHDEAAAPTPDRRRRLPWWLAAAAAAVVVAVGLAVVLVVTSDDAGYGDGVRARFLEHCTADGGEPVRSTCECLYQSIEQDVPYDEFERIDAELAAQAESRPGEPLDLPDGVQAMLDRCLDAAAGSS